MQVAGCWLLVAGCRLATGAGYRLQMEDYRLLVAEKEASAAALHELKLGHAAHDLCWHSTVLANRRRPCSAAA